MADNTVLNTGSGGDTIATDDIGGVKHQRVKIEHGADGSATDVSTASPLPVTLANTGANSTAVKVDGSAVTQPVSGTFYQATQPVSLASVPSHAVTNAGTFAVQADSVIPGTSATNLGKAEDAAHSSGDTGVLALGVRQDTLASSTSTDGDYAALKVSSTGALYVNVAEGGVTGYVEDAASAGGETGVVMLGVRRDTAASSSGTDGDFSTLNLDSTGRLHVNGSGVTQPVSGTVTANMGTVTADPFGANADAASATGSISAKLRFIAATGIPITGTVTVGSHAVTNAGTFAVQAASAGDVAHDGADSGNPVKVGGKATNVEPAAVSATGDRANFITDMVGKLITLPYANPENFVSGAITTAMTGTTSTSLVAAPGAGLRNYITTIIVSNAHATVGTDIAIQDGSGGTTLLTIPAAAVYGGAAITLPVPLRQPTANTALFCANVTTGASTKCSAVGYKGA